MPIKKKSITDEELIVPKEDSIQTLGTFTNSPYFVFLPLAIYFAYYFSMSIVPAEDAFIMFRYAENFAKGLGLVWNPGIRVEGATEFLWTMFLSLGTFLGVPTPGFAVASNFVIGAMVVVFTYFFVKRLRDGFTALCFASLVAASPLVIQALSGFGTPLFTLTMLFATYFAYTENKRAMAISALLMSLTRPEGVIYSAVLILYLLFKGGDKKWVLYYVVPGLIYYLSRYWYYGLPFPNTFYAKHQGIFFHMQSVWNYLEFIIPLFPLLLFKKHRLFWLPILFPLVYVLIEPSQNIGYRFQFPAMASALLLVEFRWKEEVSLFIVAAMMAVLLMLSTGNNIDYDDRRFVGESLSKIKGTMVSTEAGWLPYYSGWKSIDPFGLYDTTVARHGLTTEYLEKIKPDLVMWHCYAFVNENLQPIPMQPGTRLWASEEKWNSMIDTLYAFTTKNNYILIGIAGMPWDNRWYWIKEPNLYKYVLYDTKVFAMYMQPVE